MKVLLFIILTLACSRFYRMGGSSKYNTLYRDVGCSICNLLSLLLLHIDGQWWMYLLSFGLLWGAYSCYHKYLNKWFGDSKDDVKWYGWLMHGFTIGCALLTFYPHFGVVVVGRAFFLGVAMMILSETSGDVDVEEYGRGFLSNITILFLAQGGM